MSNQCKFMCERRQPGRRYVDDRWQCRHKTNHESGYCHKHRWKADGYDAFGQPIITRKESTMNITIELNTTNGFEDNAKQRKYTNRRRLNEALLDLLKNINTDNRFDETAFDTELGLILRSPSTISTITIDDENYAK